MIRPSRLSIDRACDGPARDGPARDGGSGRARLPIARARLGVLSIHLDGAPCRVGCEFCYLGARRDGGSRAIDASLVEDALARLDYDEVAVAISEPVEPALAPLAAIVRAASWRGRPVAITTTAQALAAAPSLADGVARVNLSVDPRKGLADPARIERVASTIRAPGREVVLIATLVDPGFAARLVGGGLLAALVDLPSVDKVALNALKPPPAWCGRAFWVRAAARLAPLLERHLDRKLFLDCWVAARIFRLGDCPARPDLSPGPAGALAFRSCVYQAAPDLAVTDGATLADALAGFTAPAACPFPIPD